MRRTGLSTVLALSILWFISVSSAQQTSTNYVPNLIRYNGTLKDMQGTASIPPTAVGITFAIYKQQDGGAPLWQETQNVIPDANGQYNVMLGSTKSEGVPADLFSDQDQRWLGVKIEGQPEQARVLMVSVPYAFRAHEAETLGGLPASAFVQVNPGGVPGSAVNAPTNAPSTLSPVGSANLSPFSPVTGIGKKNFIPIWTSSSTLESSALFQNGGNVGLGTMTPGAKLDVLAGPGATVGGGINARGGSYGLSATATAVHGYTVGVYGQNASNNGAGVSGTATATSGYATGVYGQTASITGAGVSGNATSTNGQATGVFGQSVNWVGVGGMATATSGGPAYGVWGDSLSTSGSGVAGYADATSGGTNGVYGQSASINGNGVLGNAIATSGITSGVYGQSASTSGAGVNGNASAASGYTSGVFGVSASTSGSGVNGAATATSGYTNGVSGSTASDTGNGVSGNATNTAATNSYGVSGTTASTGFGAGVIGTAQATTGNAFGVFGGANGSSGNGVFGYASATSGYTRGVAGFVESPNGTAGQFTTHSGSGLLLQGNSGSNFTQVFYVDASGNGYFAGNLNVTGNLTKGSGSFKIDHPLDPANKYLSHSFVESPDMMDVYNGNVTTDKRGRAIVTLPDYFQALNSDFRYQLTVIGQFAQAIVAKEIRDNHFTIKTNLPGVKVSWQVTGIRQDAYANVHRVPVEEQKQEQERGKYLHPEVFGAVSDKNMSAQLH